MTNLPATTDRKGRCLVCGEGLAQTVVWCTRCATPHHRDCFAYTGHCALFGCQCTEYADDPRGRAVSALTMLDDFGVRMPQMEFLDYTSEREALLEPRWIFTCAMALGGGGFVTGFAPLFLASSLAFVAGVVAWWASGQVSDYHIADRRHGILWHHREWMGKANVAMECGFEDIRALVVTRHTETRQPEPKRYYTAVVWTPWVELHDGRRIKITDGEAVAAGSADDSECPPLVRERLEYLRRFFRVELEWD
jgi:hypothetical protein